MRLSILLLALAATAASVACSTTSTPAALPSDADAILVTHGTDTITVENKFPARLLGVRIELAVSDTPQPYILTVPAIEQGAKAEVQIANFKTESADVAVDPASLHPTQVTIKARDTYGKPHETTVPWVQ